LVQTGTILSESVINKLKKIGYTGLYINDAVSVKIKPKDVVSNEVRREATTAIRNIMSAKVEEKAKFVQTNLKEISDVLNQIIDEIMSSDSSVINIIDMKNFDEYTYEHSVNVCVLSCVIGMGYNMSQTELYKLGLAAILHDIGKIFIDENILNKPGKLTSDEYEVMKTHSTIGVEKLNLGKELPPTVTSAILQHHERYDGSGYPFGKKENEIPENAQIISMVDVYDAITTNRPYRSQISPAEAYEYISGNSGRAFNPELVQVFLKKIAPFPLGVEVLLSDGRSGIVCKNHEDNLLRPVISLFATNDTHDGHEIDLNNDVDSYNITIEKILM